MQIWSKYQCYKDHRTPNKTNKRKPKSWPANAKNATKALASYVTPKRTNPISSDVQNTQIADGHIHYQTTSNI